MRKEIERLGHYLLRSPYKIGSQLRLGYATKLSSAKGFRRKEFASSLPPLMTIQIYNLCNLRCTQCWEWGDNGAYKEIEHKTLKDEMSTEQWETFIEEVSEWRPYLYFFRGRASAPQRHFKPMLRPLLTRWVLAGWEKYHHAHSVHQRPD